MVAGWLAGWLADCSQERGEMLFQDAGMTLQRQVCFFCWVLNQKKVDPVW